MTEIKTDNTLLKAMKRATVRHLSPEEIQRQRVSFVMGMKGDTNHMTRAQVEDILAKNEGKKVPA